MPPGVGSDPGEIALVRALLEPQAELATTDKLPAENEGLKLTVTVVVPWPDVMLAPVGAVHV